jgi:hypothetical protein
MPHISHSRILTSLVLPEISEPLGRKFAIPNSMLDVLVTEIVLQRPSIDTLISQLEPSRMPQHVGMDWKRHFGGRPKPRHHPAKGNCGHGSAALAHEDISSGFLFALETAQGAKFDAGQWVDGQASRREVPGSRSIREVKQWARESSRG